jgi:hypothetical protein
VPIPVLFGKYIYQGPILFGAFMQHELEKATQNGQLARGVAHEILHEIAGSGRFTFDDEELPEEDDQAISILVEAAHDLWTRGILDQANSPGGLQGCYIDSISDRGWEYVFAAVAEANNKNQLQLAEKLARAGSMPRSFQVLQAEINCSIEDIYQIADLCKTVEQMNGQVDIKALRQSVKQYFAAGV